MGGVVLGIHYALNIYFVDWLKLNIIIKLFILGATGVFGLATFLFLVTIMKVFDVSQILQLLKKKRGNNAKQTIMDNDMLILLSSRKSTASYHPLFEEIPAMLTQHFTGFSSMVVYPEQLTGGPDMDTLLTEIPPASKTWSMITRAKQLVKRILRIDKDE